MEFFVYGSDDRLLRAAKRLRVVKQKIGYNGGWMWMLPEHFPAWQAEQAAKMERSAAERNERREKKPQETPVEKSVAGLAEVLGASSRVPQNAAQSVAGSSGSSHMQGQETFGQGAWQGRETRPQHPGGRPDKTFARWEKRRPKS
jgi:hypothetical protein